MTGKAKKSGQNEKVVMSVCNHHCGGQCMLKVHVKDGVIVRIETDDGEEPQVRACLKGRAYRQKIYSPDRLKFPMKRVGKRGSGEFERVSWDEALDTIAREITRVRDTYGPGSIVFAFGGGDIGYLHRPRLMHRLLGMAGGYSKTWGFTSCEGGVFASKANYGTLSTRNSRDDLLNSRLIILWGWNPAYTVQDTNTCWYLAQARESGTKIVSVDPRYTDTAVLADQWIPIIPGTDAAMLIAMAYVMIKENLHDQKFLDKYTIGFDRFKEYVLGIEDSVPKSPLWAEAITGVAAGTIADLARAYATTKPAALIGGIGPGRSACGEQYHRAAMTLAAMTGNIGIRGGDAAGRNWTGVYGFPFMKIGEGLTGMETFTNPVEENNPPRWNLISAGGKSAQKFTNEGSINVAQIADAILKGRQGGYPFDYKLLCVMYTNYLNQYPNINKIVEAFNKLEFIAVMEHLMSPTARVADILLPTCTFLERNDVTIGEGVPFYGYMNKAVEPQDESRSPFDITVALAKRLGIADFSNRTEDEWLREMVKDSLVPDYDEFKRKGIFRPKLSGSYVAFEKEIADPANNPFPTPSGKIEIYSQRLADMHHPALPPIPKYVESWESRNDPLAQKYPLQLITTHFKRRAHSQFETLPWLRELQPQTILINTRDAATRGIKNGDMVRVFNSRGEMRIQASVTERIMPGVVDIGQGAYYDPDETGVDRGGSANVLTSDQISPGGAVPYNTNLVEVRRL